MRKYITLIESAITGKNQEIAELIANGECEGFDPYWKLFADDRVLSDQDAINHISSRVYDGFTHGAFPNWELVTVVPEVEAGVDVPEVISNLDAEMDADIDLGHEEIDFEEVEEPVTEDIVDIYEFADKSNFIVTLHAVHDRGPKQQDALRELEKRGIELSDSQKAAAALDVEAFPDGERVAKMDLVVGKTSPIFDKLRKG